jgi:6-phosphogluconate dehydrogenase
MDPKEIAAIFREWNRGLLDSYLVEISAEVLEAVDSDTGQPLVDVILDCAGQKGTGLWTAVSALEVGSPATTITHSVFARALSALKEDRVLAAKHLSGPQIDAAIVGNRDEFIQQLHDALYCSKICAYAQGFQLMKTASDEHNWHLDFAGIAKIWRAGCIIRAVFLQSITNAYDTDDDLHNLLLDPYFAEQISNYHSNWRQAIAKSTLLGIPCGGFSSALAYYDSYRTETLPANLLQGQRDFFGAHTFERTDKPRGKHFHVEWSQPGQPMIKMK